MPGGQIMGDGFWGRVLWVDLTTRRIWEEALPEAVYRRYLGGYGLGVAILYERMPAGADPLGPENILGFLPGLLTGSGALFSGRFMVVARSPLTGGWGEANCGGNFGPALRGAGYDGLFVTGMAERPVYLYIDSERAELRDATDMWGIGRGGNGGGPTGEAGARCAGGLHRPRWGAAIPPRRHC
jgi:aldehyde:ferredoxin oxidoreductase